MKTIKKIYDNELNNLNHAVKDGKSLYHTFTLSSIKDNVPESRTVVLRDVKINPFKIYFNADYRSPKVKQLLSNNLCSALFYNIQSRTQIRLTCHAIMYYNNNFAKKVWDKTALQSRKCYMGPYAPSQQLKKWHPNIPLEYLKKDPDKKHSEEGYINFTHIELEIIQTDILQLHHDGHIRFKYDNQNNIYYVSP